jgi:hypothetical protein
MSKLFKTPMGQLPASSTQGGLGKEGLGVLDSVLFALTGTPDAALAPEDMQARQQRRNQAGNAAASFANSGGDSAEGFMGAPGAGGSGFGLDDIIKLVGGVI